MRHFVLPVALAGAIGIMAAAGAQPAKPDARLRAIEQRQADMKRLGAPMKLLAGFVKGEPTNPREVKAAGAAIRDISKRMHRFWPQGTEAGVGKSKAKADIWSNQAGFRQRLAEFRTAAAMMERAAASGDRARVAQALGPVGASCKSCHSSFQVEN